MDKYQKMQNALSELLNISFVRLQNIPNGKVDAYKKGVLDCKSRLHSYEKYEKTSTLEEVKQEWEEYFHYKETYIGHDRLCFKNYDKNGVYTGACITFNTKDKTYSSTFYITLEEHQLITKTCRALGWFE